MSKTPATRSAVLFIFIAVLVDVIALGIILAIGVGYMLINGWTPNDDQSHWT